MRSLKLWIVLLAADGDSGCARSRACRSSEVSSDTLSKQHLTLPADFHTDRNLLLLYFDLTQQPDVDSWNTVMDRLACERSILDCLYFTGLFAEELPLALVAEFLDAQRVLRIPAAGRRLSRCISISTAFERRLQISSEKEVVLLLLDRKGHVLSRVSGPPNDSSRNAMRAALNAAGSPAASAPAGTSSH